MRRELVQEFMALGMTEREAKLYLAMLEKPEWQAGELHRLTGVPRVQTHRTLELMVTRRYCTKRSEGRFNFYRATPPTDLKEILSERWEEENSRRIRHASQTLDSVQDLFLEGSREDHYLDFIEIVQTPNRVHRRFLELIESAKEEILGFNRSPYSFSKSNVSVKKVHEQTDANTESFDRGVHSKTLIMYEPDIWKILKEELRSWDAERRSNVRVIDYLPIKLFVIDRKTTFMGIHNILPQQHEVMSQVVIHDSGFAELCHAAFWTFWDRATPLDEWEKKESENEKKRK